MLDTALKYNPDEASLFATYAEIYAARGEYRDATRLMQKASSLAPRKASYRERFLYFREQLKRESN